VRRFLKWLLRGIAVAVCLFVVAAVAFALHCSTQRGNFQPSPPSTNGKVIAGYARPEDDTFLTYAEWYIVWSYQEKARWQEAHLPSGFPYFQAIGQYWSGYCCSYSVVRGRYPFNFGDHLMLVVIGTSFTIEYALKGAYETTLGRLSEWIGGNQATDEDRLAARVAEEYGAFVADRPFYEFSFSSALRRLWVDTSLWGPHLTRKWERKAWLSLDYGVEAVYCGLIELASHGVYGVEDDFTYALIDNGAIVRMPRYRKFTDAAVRMLAGEARFVEIAGNRQVMVTAIVPADWSYSLPTGEMLFSSPLLTDRLSKRVVLRVPVADLGQLTGAMRVEHIYDY